MENVFPPGAVAELEALLASDAAAAAPLGLGFDGVFAGGPGLAAVLAAGDGPPPDTEPGSSPERQPGVEMDPSLDLLCLEDRVKREAALPSL